MDAYREQLQSFVYASGTTMKPIFTMAKNAAKKKVAFCEGEEERAARRPDRGRRIGGAPDADRPAQDHRRAVEKFGLRLQEGRDYDVVNVEQDDRYRDFWQTYHRMTDRKGVTVQMAKIEMRRRLTLIGAMLLHKDQVDGMICGTWGTTDIHLRYLDQVIGKRAGVNTYACMNGLMLPGRPAVPGRHARQLRPQRGAAGRDHAAGGRGNAALRPQARSPC